MECLTSGLPGNFQACIPKVSECSEIFQLSSCLPGSGFHFSALWSQGRHCDFCDSEFVRECVFSPECLSLLVFSQ